MTQPEQIAIATNIVIEQDPVRIIQSPVVDHLAKTIFDTYTTDHGINVQVVQGDTKHDVVYDKTIWQGFFYERRIARTMKKAQRIAGALAIGHAQL